MYLCRFFLFTAGLTLRVYFFVFAATKVKKSPRVEITATEGLRLTTEVKTEEVEGRSGSGSSDGDGAGGGRSSKRNSKKRDSAAAPASSKGDKPSKSGCSVM